MDPLKPAQENIISIKDEKQQEKKITHEQIEILWKAHLANILLFWAGTLNPEQQKQKKNLQQQYLQDLRPWDIVEIWLQWMMPYHTWEVVSNNWQITKIKANCYLNKKNKIWIRSFSTIDWLSKWFLMNPGDFSYERQHFFVVIPESHTVKSTAWLPKEAIDEIYELYKKAWRDPKTCYDLLDNLDITQNNKF